MKINYALISRSLIAILFIVAGIQKLTGLKMTSGFIGQLLHVSSPVLATLATLIVVFIEVVVAAAYAYGYRVCVTGGILATFTVVATLLVHNNFPADLVMFLKNLAIIGGIISTIITCECGNGKCPATKKHA